MSKTKTKTTDRPVTALEAARTLFYAGANWSAGGGPAAIPHLAAILGALVPPCRSCEKVETISEPTPDYEETVEEEAVRETTPDPNEALASMPGSSFPSGDSLAMADEWLKERRRDKGQRTCKPPSLQELLAAFAASPAGAAIASLHTNSRIETDRRELAKRRAARASTRLGSGSL